MSDEDEISVKQLVDALGTIDLQQTDKILESATIEAVAKYIKSKNVQKIIVMSGAGISTASGIPDFRTKGTGLYDNLSKYNLPYPEAVFDISYFKKNPVPFYLLAKELFPGNYKPTKTHCFIKVLSDNNILLRNYTQNIDTLEREAGIHEKFLVEAHGSFSTGSCLGYKVSNNDSSDSSSSQENECTVKLDQAWFKKQLEIETVPSCPECGSLVKPDITFFGEGLPFKFFNLLEKDFDECELLIVMGTSLQVQPFASLVDKVPLHCPRLLINREIVGSGFDFKWKHSSRDVFHPSDCDDASSWLAELLGYKQQLEMEYSRHHTSAKSDIIEKVVTTE